MNMLKKITAAALSCSILLGAMPLAATAADDEPVVMNAEITLNGDSITATGDNVTVSGKVVTISASGAYQITGTLNDGQICVNVPDSKTDSGTVKLFFNGVNITGVSEAAVYVVNAENTSINLIEGTENFIYDGEKYTDTTAAIYAKDDITIKGSGSLRVEAAYQYGLHCNNDVKVTGGNIKFKTKAQDALRGKTSVQIKGGTIDINSEGDGVKSTKGKVVISGGDLQVKASNDAIQAETRLEINGGSVKANGDRSLTCAETGEGVAILGGTVLASATDNAIANLLTGTQPVVSMKFNAEQIKDQEVTILDGGEKIFAVNPDKKFSYLTLSSPLLEVGKTYTYELGAKNILNQDGSEFVQSDIAVSFDAVYAAKKTLNGDFNLNGVTDIADAILLARFLAEDTEISVQPEGKALMDLNGDKYTTSDDLTMLLCYLAGLPF